MTDEFLTRCVVDPSKRKFYLYSNQGDEKTVDCENMEEFMNVLELVRRITPEDVLAYANPL
jgi:imidazoleglycerol phosphate dehydratase HisB